MTEGTHQALMDVASLVSNARADLCGHMNAHKAGDQGHMAAYDMVLNFIINKLNESPFKYSPIPAIEADLRRRIDDE